MTDGTQTPEEAADELREFLVHAHSAVVEWSHPTAFLVKIPDSTPAEWLVTVEDEGLTLRADDWNATVDEVDDAIALIENEMLPA
jgi:hypothetical protein